jgi:DNA-binding response OmpR family regulator
MLRLVLEQNGYTVLVASSGHAAFPHVEALRSTLALVILDLTLPNMDGLETYQILRNLSPELPIILTGDIGSPSVVRFLRGGGSVFVSKPISPVRLLEAMKNLQRGQRLGPVQPPLR